MQAQEKYNIEAEYIKKTNPSEKSMDLVDLLIAEFNLPLDIDPAEIPFMLRQKINQSHLSVNTSQSALFSEKQKMIIQLQQQIIALQQENQNLQKKSETIDSNLGDIINIDETSKKLENQHQISEFSQILQLSNAIEMAFEIDLFIHSQNNSIISNIKNRISIRT